MGTDQWHEHGALVALCALGEAPSGDAVFAHPGWYEILWAWAHDGREQAETEGFAYSARIRLDLANLPATADGAALYEALVAVEDPSAWTAGNVIAQAASDADGVPPVSDTAGRWNALEGTELGDAVRRAMTSGAGDKIDAFRRSLSAYSLRLLAYPEMIDVFYARCHGALWQWVGEAPEGTVAALVDLYGPEWWSGLAVDLAHLWGPDWGAMSSAARAEALPAVLSRVAYERASVVPVEEDWGWVTPPQRSQAQYRYGGDWKETVARELGRVWSPHWPSARGEDKAAALDAFFGQTDVEAEEPPPPAPDPPALDPPAPVRTIPDDRGATRRQGADTPAVPGSAVNADSGTRTSAPKPSVADGERVKVIVAVPDAGISWQSSTMMSDVTVSTTLAELGTYGLPVNDIAALVAAAFATPDTEFPLRTHHTETTVAYDTRAHGDAAHHGLFYLAVEVRGTSAVAARNDEIIRALRTGGDAAKYQQLHDFVVAYTDGDDVDVTLRAFLRFAGRFQGSSLPGDIRRIRRFPRDRFAVTAPAGTKVTVVEELVRRWHTGNTITVATL